MVIVGLYASDIEGLEFTVIAQNNKFYITETGGVADEVIPYRYDATGVGFRYKHARYEFEMEKDHVVRMQLKAPGFTLQVVPQKA
jgi:hypothetical protein